MTIIAFVLYSILQSAIQTDSGVHVEEPYNFKNAPATLTGIRASPGFVVTNNSSYRIARVRFGCAANRSSKTQVIEEFDAESMSIGPRGHGNVHTVHGWTKYQFICAQQHASLTILELFFSKEVSWKAPTRLQH